MPRTRKGSVSSCRRAAVSPMSRARGSGTSSSLSKRGYTVTGTDIACSRLHWYSPSTSPAVSDALPRS